MVIEEKNLQIRDRPRLHAMPHIKDEWKEVRKSSDQTEQVRDGPSRIDTRTVSCRSGYTSSTTNAIGLGLAEVAKHRVDEFESSIDFLADFGAGEHDLAADEDEKNDLGLHHAVDQAGEQFRLVGRESMMARCQTLQANGELDCRLLK